jgi:AmmeMemoRadiSam system protein A
MSNVLYSSPDHARSPAEPVDVPPATQRQLLEVARAALAAVAGRLDLSTFERTLEESAGADQQAAVFVTLTEHGDLRGCIGTLDARRPLCRAVAAATIGAALDDPRFAPLSAEELPATSIGISVLGPFHPIVDPDSFRPGVDGVLVESGGHVGLLLPEVALTDSLGATEMFTAVCRKAGLAADAWRDDRARLSTFTTTSFGGPALGSGS